MAFTRLLSPLLFLILSQIANADSTTHSGAALMQKYCAECHAKDGNSPTDKAPRIAGFSALLIFDTLDQFRHGDRPAPIIRLKNQKETTMQAIAKNLNDGEAEAIAAFLSKQQFKPALNKPLPVRLAKMIQQGKQLHQDLCNDCHGEYGSSAQDDAPILLGQWRNYLLNQFEQFSLHKRYISKRMKRKFSKLSSQDKQALIAFYTQ